jgi:hypothetical protein
MERYHNVRGLDIPMYDPLLMCVLNSTTHKDKQVQSFLSVQLVLVAVYKPQLVGFNSASADLKAFVQRAVVLGIQAKGFCSRPNNQA